MTQSQTSNLESPIVFATVPGKIILFGEHAVVYGRPAIAVPVFQVQARAEISSFILGAARNFRVGERDSTNVSLSRTDKADVEIDAVDLRRRYWLREARADDAIATIIRLTCEKLGVTPQGFRVRITSTIPIGGGLGSGAAVSVSIARALGKYFSSHDIAGGRAAKESPSSELDADERGQTSSAAIRIPALSGDDISNLAYQVEKLHHGTPSGIDNTVIAFEQPVYFVKGKPIESFRVAQPFTIAIADSGIPAPTKISVGDVRRAWEADKEFFERLFDHVGTLVGNARVMIERGEITGLGGLMTANQIDLATMGVSSVAIQKLVDAALGAGALGAKLSGGGRGGNVIALVTRVTQDKVAQAMMDAGAKRVIVTEIGASSEPAV